MKPEEKARILIDRMLDESGWLVAKRDDFSPAVHAMAIEEGLMKGNKEADYLLFLNGKAIGILEAKRAENNLGDKVKEQALGYARGCPSWCAAWMNPLPFAYMSNGTELYFRDTRDKTSDFIQVNRVLSPKEMVKILGIADEFAGLPTLKKRGLRDCQYEAISALEDSFRSGQDRALMVLATGAGKTYTACTAAYRFLSYTPMKRVLFLVDRNNLGRQAENEFGTYKLTENGDPFNTIYGVERLNSGKIPSDANVIICTIQRLFSLLSGEDITDTDDDEETPDPGKAVELPGIPSLPKDYFDLIIIDECHRSIYNNWKKVLDYFNTARMIGLTATPLPDTLAFFNNNLVSQYTLEQSIVDGVNVDHRVYRIKTKETEDGGAIREGQKVKRVTCYTGKVEQIKPNETKQYTKEELNRSIINPAQIKLILETYRDAIYTDMYPERDPDMNYIPKTLIFALNDAHATNIVHLAKEVFGKENDDQFVQKITYSAGDSNDLIRHFRNDKEFRIAVTVTLVATGTDVKPLEVLLFMRDVESWALYTQMVGRGVRTIGDDALRNVTPNSLSKDLFFLVDAVGVTEHSKTIGGNAEPQQPLMTLKMLLERISHGEVNDDNLRLLAARLSRINNKCNEEQKNEFYLKSGVLMKELATQIYQAMENGLPPYTDVNQPNTERKSLVRALAVQPQAREYLLILNAGFVNILQPGEDTLISKGFSLEEAKDTTEAFEAYVTEHADEIEALRILYNHTGEPITYSLLKDLENKLKMQNHKFNIPMLWNTYSLVSPNTVQTFKRKDEKEALTNLIQLARYAYKQIEKLDSVSTTAAQYFNLWCGQRNNEKTQEQIDVMRQIVDYIVANGACSVKEIREDDKTRAAQLIKAFGGKDQANAALNTLFKYIVYRKTA